MHQLLPSHRILLVLSAILLSRCAFGQYHFPQASILIEQGIRAIHVNKAALHYVDRTGKIDHSSELDTLSKKVAIFFLNEWGAVDSVYHYPTSIIDSASGTPSGWNFWKKEVFEYGADHQLVDVKTIEKDGKLSRHTELKALPEGGWLIRYWEHGTLRTESFATIDSIVYETFRYSFMGEGHSYMHYHYDLELDKRTETWHKGDEVVIQRSYHWFSENGVPRQMEYFDQEQTATKRKPYRTKTFEVDSGGNVINKYNGSIFDPFYNHNFFDRLERFKGLNHRYMDLFTDENMVHAIESDELWTYDGTSIRYIYGLLYESIP